MKRNLIVIFLLLPLSLTGGEPQQDRETLFQVSTIKALVGGDYTGFVSLKELSKQGDIGLGTFHGLHGEMIQVDGTIYRVDADGKVDQPSMDEKTPFACTTHFEADQTTQLQPADGVAALVNQLNEMIRSPNLFHVIRIDGRFEYLKTRSVPKQEPPYPPLSHITADQPTFTFKNVRGTLVGLRCPDYMTDLNVPGYHFHFITESRDGGGHVLELRISKGKAQIDITRNFLLNLNEKD